MQPTPDQFPNYHFLLVAPNLGAEWLFDAARQYWERYLPTVVSDLELVRLIPPDFAIIVTVIARRDTAPQWGVTLAQTVAHALPDMMIYDYFEDMKQALNSRAELGQPFGVPLRPTAAPDVAISPTPGPIIGENQPPTATPSRQGGFITTTPAPTSEPGGPIYPTPGPITGGG
jgi:hypothetical protein